MAKCSFAWVSTVRLSQIPGQVRAVRVQLQDCLKEGAGHFLFHDSFPLCSISKCFIPRRVPTVPLFPLVVVLGKGNL
jgi:hypothetical protein